MAALVAKIVVSLLFGRFFYNDVVFYSAVHDGRGDAHGEYVNVYLHYKFERSFDLVSCLLLF